MPGYVFKGTAQQAGASFYLPEWYAQLYTRLPDIKTAALAGWSNEGAHLVNGPDMRQMTEYGTGASVAVAPRAALGDVPAYHFTGKLIDTRHPRTADFTLIALVHVSDAVITGGTDVLMQAEGGANGDLSFQVAWGTIVPALVIATGEFVGGGVTSLANGPHVLIATCRNTGTDEWLVKTFADTLDTPLQSATLTTASTLGGNWIVGGHLTNPGLIWGGPIAGFLIIDRDVTESASDQAVVEALLPDMLTWMGA